MFSSTQKTISIPDENKKEQKFILDNMTDIMNYSDELITVVKRYLEPKPKENVAMLHTKWGNYEMPEDYKIQLGYGPRTDLRTCN